MSQREPILIKFVIIVALSLFCFIQVNCKHRTRFPKLRRAMLVKEITSNETTPSPVERLRLRGLAKYRRRALLDSLIAQMSNSSKPPVIDWENYGLRRNSPLNFAEVPHRFSTAGNVNSNGNGNSDDNGDRNGNVNGDANDNYRPRLQTEDKLNYQLAQAEPPPDNRDADKKKQNLNPEGQSSVLNVYSIGAQLRKLLRGAEYTNVSINGIGRTAEYNEIILLQATELKDKSARNFRSYDNKYADDVPQKNIVFIVHGLSVMGFKEIPCLIVVKKFMSLLKSYFVHLDKFDIYLVPMANPDGVAYSYHFPLWNKNMSPQDSCPGVALDRNFDVSWKTMVKSCNQQFPGDHPFSEPETRAIREVFHRYSDKIIAYIHVHGGGYHEHIYKGDAVLYPRGFTDAPGDDDKYIDLKGEIDEVMKNATFKSLSVTVDTLHNWYGQVHGASVDYAATVYGIPYALEFVMQLYEVDPYAPNSNETLADAAQDEIWHRLIDAILKYIYRSSGKHISSDVRKSY